MTKVSVILPNFNHANYIKSRIESILSQSYDDFELIILDDASSDGSAAFIESFSKEPRVSSIIFNEKNSGSTFKQWIKGLELARGEYIWIAESDDLASTNFLDTHISFLDSNPDFGISFSPSNWIDENSEITHKPGHEEEGFYKSGSELLMNEFLRGPLIYNASSAVFRRDLLTSIDLKKIENFFYAGDWYFWKSLAKNTKVARQKNRLNYFRRHQNNVSSKADKEGQGIKEGLKIIEEILKENKISLKQKTKLKFHWVRRILNQPLENKLKYLYKFITL